MTIDLASIARFVTGGAFLAIGIRNISNHSPLTDLMRQRGVPLPSFSAWAGIAMQIGFGALLATGVAAPIAALGLAVFVAGATWIAHWPFDKTGVERSDNITACLANSIMFGGLLAHTALTL